MNCLCPSGAGLARLIPTSGPWHEQCLLPRVPCPKTATWLAHPHFQASVQMSPPQRALPDHLQPKSLPYPITLFISIRPCHLGSFYWATFNKHHAEGHFFPLSSPVMHLHSPPGLALSLCTRSPLTGHGGWLWLQPEQKQHMRHFTISGRDLRGRFLEAEASKEKVPQLRPGK